jgi:bacterioferritin-associated ferredoxin
VIVCCCRAVGDREIRALIRGGARDLDAIAAACGAGRACGACVVQIVDLLADAGELAPCAERVG